jgi:bifunctional non-homologous end joining protein LigD
LYPEAGITKLDLARYYERVEEWILPHISRRPLTLVRCPDGWEAECFYQKHLEDPAPAVKPVAIVEEDGERATYRYVEDLAGVVSLVQLGALELHVWGSRVDHLEQPDMLVFDVDPAPDLPWRQVAAAARALRDRLDRVGLASWLKTTGGKGLHVVVPLVPDTDWEVARQFSRALVESLEQRHPDRYLIKASKSARRGKVFLDYLRNGRGATAVVAFSARARPRATVSMPLRWEELHDREPTIYTVETAPKRLSRLRRDPWEGFFESRQSLGKLAAAFEDERSSAEPKRTSTRRARAGSARKRR